MVLLLLVYGVMYFPLCVGDPFLFCYVLLCVLSSFAMLLKRKRDMAALLLLPCGCLIAVYVLWLFLAGAVGWSAMCDCGIS